MRERHVISLNKCLCTQLPIAGHDLANMNSFVAILKIKVFEMVRENLKIRQQVLTIRVKVDEDKASPKANSCLG